MQGVIQRTYDDYRRSKGLPLQSVFKISRAELEEIYRERYWNVIQGDYLPMGPDYGTFDGSVNSGTRQGPKWLQRAVGGIKVDGIVGAKTLTAVAMHPDHAELVRRMCKLRMGFLQSLSTFDVFGRGWTRRVASVEAVGVKMALEAAALSNGAIAAKLDTEAGKAEEAKRAETGKALGSGTAAAGGAAGSQTDPNVLTTSPGLDSIPPDILPWVLGAIGLIGAFFLLRSLWLRKVHRDRATAYAATAAATT